MSGMTIVTINLPRGDERTAWQAARLALEGFEPGSSKHCMRRDRAPGGGETYTHHRVGLEITVYGGRGPYAGPTLVQAEPERTVL